MSGIISFRPTNQTNRIMKITEFLLKRIVGETDCLIGFDKDGQLIRISVPNLKSSLGVTKVEAQSISVQYSLDKLTWHSTFTDGDLYMRIKCGSGAWTGAICIKVSAYETWKEKNGGTGTVEQFLAAIKGSPGDDADISGLKISNLSDYDELIEKVGSIVDEKTSSLSDAWTEHKQNVSEALNEMGEKMESSEVGNLKSVNALSPTDLFAVNTTAGMRKITLDTLLDNLAVKMASRNGLQKLSGVQRKVFPLKESPNGTRVSFSTEAEFVAGTSQLYLNGYQLIAGSDYLETSSTTIKMLTHIPSENDIMVFIALSA